MRTLLRVAVGDLKFEGTSKELLSYSVIREEMDIFFSLFAYLSPINREKKKEEKKLIAFQGGVRYTFCKSIMATDSGSSGKFNRQDFFSHYIYTI